MRFKLFCARRSMRFVVRLVQCRVCRRHRVRPGNTGFGLFASGTALEATPAVGAHDKGLQNYAGDMMVKWMERNTYGAVNSFYPRGTTCVGHDGCPRRPDYLLGPLTVRPQVAMLLGSAMLRRCPNARLRTG